MFLTAPTVEILYCSENPNYNDDSIENLENLREIIFYCNEHITEEAVGRKLGQLETLSCSECPQITIEFIRDIKRAYPDMNLHSSFEEQLREEAEEEENELSDHETDGEFSDD